MADKYLVNSADLTSVADAIRNKAGISSSISFPTGFISSITNIQTGAEIKTCTVRILPNTGNGWIACEPAPIDGYIWYTKYENGVISAAQQEVDAGTTEYDLTLENVVCGSVFNIPSMATTVEFEGANLRYDEVNMQNFVAPTEPNVTAIVKLGIMPDAGGW
jgi:hypothetical protein